MISLGRIGATTVLALSLFLGHSPTTFAQEAHHKESDRLYLWKVTPKVGRNVVYLLGSIHAGTEDMYPLPDEIEAAFDECAVLAVEVDLASQDQEALQTFLAENGLYLDGDTLARHL